jgi:hypothetical protein
MIDLIQGEFRKITSNCIKNYAKKKGVNKDSVQLILGLNQNGNTYTLCENYVRKEEYDIMQVLDVKIDFLGYSRMAPPFIMKSLIRFGEKHEVDFDKIFVMCVPTINEKGKDDIKLFLYKGVKYLETIEFGDLFDEQDIEMPKI